MNFSHQGYEILEEIGEGGAGKVYKAYHKNLRKIVVIKQLKAIMDDDIQRVEVDILKNLHHSYLPQVFDFFIIDHTAYTVMDYIEGESLKSKLDRG
nr:protein kinase [Lachnospiraceae bacterium]